jgi:hypothetical protein
MKVEYAAVQDLWKKILTIIVSIVLICRWWYKMDGKPWYSIRKGVNVNLLMSAGVASGSKLKGVATGSRLVKHKYYSNAIAKKKDCIILKTLN